MLSSSKKNGCSFHVLPIGAGVIAFACSWYAFGLPGCGIDITLRFVYLLVILHWWPVPSCLRSLRDNGRWLIRESAETNNLLVQGMRYSLSNPIMRASRVSLFELPEGGHTQVHSLLERRWNTVHFLDWNAVSALISDGFSLGVSFGVLRQLLRKSHHRISLQSGDPRPLGLLSSVIFLGRCLTIYAVKTCSNCKGTNYYADLSAIRLFFQVSDKLSRKII